MQRPGAGLPGQAAGRQSTAGAGRDAGGPAGGPPPTRGAASHSGRSGLGMEGGGLFASFTANKKTFGSFSSIIFRGVK